MPLKSVAMESVTEHQTGSCMAHEDGIGIIHKNITAEDQTNQVKMVKRSEIGINSDPITVEPEEPLQNALDLMNQTELLEFLSLRDENLLGN